MKDNWYEVAIDVLDPSNIISVIDWASDGRSPLTYSNLQRLATYRVYRWGVSDPSQGERSRQQESTDPKASPHGWHKIPTSFVPPSLAESGFRDPVSQDTYQFTVTAGNNVFSLLYSFLIHLLSTIIRYLPRQTGTGAISGKMIPVQMLVHL